MIRIPGKVARNAKAVIAAIVALAAVASPALADQVLNADELGQLLTAALVSAGGVYSVWRTPNRDEE